jgi:hypothetical protein
MVGLGVMAEAGVEARRAVRESRTVMTGLDLCEGCVNALAGVCPVPHILEAGVPWPGPAATVEQVEAVLIGRCLNRESYGGLAPTERASFDAYIGMGMPEPSDDPYGFGTTFRYRD